MHSIFISLLLMIFYIYFGYPVILWIISRLINKALCKQDITPFVSMLIPAYNEENCIKEKIENTLSLDYPKEKLEIIVGSDGSIDKTNKIVNEYKDKNVLLNYKEERVGKVAVLKRCVEASSGEIILFSDADSMLKKDALKKLIRNFSNKEIGCVEGVRRDMNKKGILLDSLYWKYETSIKRLNSKLRSLIGATGAIYAIRKELYNPINEERGDDFEIPIRVSLQGYDTVLEEEALAYHPWLSNKDEFGRIVRIVSWMFPSAFILLRETMEKKKWLLSWQIMSHKILRWFVPFILLNMFWISFFLRGSMRIFLYLQLIFYFIAGIGFLCEKINIKLKSLLKIPYFFCLINTASCAGILKCLFGKSNMNWKKTARQL